MKRQARRERELHKKGDTARLSRVDLLFLNDEDQELVENTLPNPLPVDPSDPSALFPADQIIADRRTELSDPAFVTKIKQESEDTVQEQEESPAVILARLRREEQEEAAGRPKRAARRRADEIRLDHIGKVNLAAEPSAKPELKADIPPFPKAEDSPAEKKDDAKTASVLQERRKSVQRIYDIPDDPMPEPENRNLQTEESLTRNEDLYEPEKPEQPEKKKRTRRIRDLRLRSQLIFLCVLVGLLLCVIVGFFIAGKYSNSKANHLKRDKTPPTAVLKDVTIRNTQTAEAKDFVDSFTDENIVTYELKNPIDYSQLGDQTVTIVFTDKAGNSSEYTATLHILPEEEQTLP